MTDFYSRPFNPGISVDPVSNVGYTAGDLTSYYGNTFLLLEDPEGATVFRCSCFDSRTVASGEVLRNGEVLGETVNIDKLSRMVIPMGFYLREGKSPLIYRYLLSRSYKKGLSPEFIQLRNHSGPMRVNHKNLMHLLFPLNSKDDNEYLVSRRIAVYGGKIHTLYKNLSIGSEKDGDLITPYSCVNQRLDQGASYAF